MLADVREIELMFHPNMRSMNKYPSPKQAVILAGGRGTRLMERTVDIPKPMITIGDKTLLEHIIDIYSYQGIHEFLIPVGYKKGVIFHYFGDRCKEIFSWVPDTYFVGRFGKNVISIIDTGYDTQTGGRIKRLQPYINGPFFCTYGDGLANINLHKLQNIHFGIQNVDVTITAVHPIPRFGALKLDGNFIVEFGEKQQLFHDWVNGGFMLMNPHIFNYIDDDNTNLEIDVLPYVANIRELAAHKHDGFWYCCDTIRDVLTLEEIYKESGAEWLKIFG